MKQALLIIALCACVATTSVDARRHDNHRNRNERTEHVRGHRCGGQYFVDGRHVFFDGHEVKDASASSFRILRDGYAKDAWNAYHNGHKIKGASSASFKALGEGYAGDAWNVYYYGTKIKKASRNNFI